MPQTYPPMAVTARAAATAFRLGSVEDGPNRGRGAVGEPELRQRAVRSLADRQPRFRERIAAVVLRAAVRVGRRRGRRKIRAALLGELLRHPRHGHGEELLVGEADAERVIER